jgi:hypothetical protein
VAFVLSRSRSQYEDSRRWHEDRLDIYLDVITQSWKIQDAVFNHFELDEPLPDDLSETMTNLNAAGTKVRLIGSVEVQEVTERLVIEGASAVSHARQDQSGKGLDACDNIRHTLYYFTDLVRAELTNDRTAVALWHRRQRWWRRVKPRRFRFQSPPVRSQPREDGTRTAREPSYAVLDPDP